MSATDYFPDMPFHPMHGALGFTTIYTILQNALPTIILKRQTLPQQTMYYWKTNSIASIIHFIYWKNILISRLYERFSRSHSEMVPEWLSEKISKFKNMNILYIALKHVIWTFRNYFHKIFKFRDFVNALRNFTKSIFAYIFVKFKYFVKQLILTESPSI